MSKKKKILQKCFLIIDKSESAKKNYLHLTRTRNAERHIFRARTSSPWQRSQQIRRGNLSAMRKKSKYFHPGLCHSSARNEV